MPKPLRRAVPLGVILVSASAFAYATYGVWIQLLGTYFGTFTQIVMRAGLAILLLVPIALWRRDFSPIRWSHRWWLLAMFAAAFAVQAPLYYAIRHIGVGLGIALVYIGIVLGAFLFGRLFADEAFTRRKAISTLLGLLGILLIFNPTGQSITALGLTAALVSGLATGGVMVCFRRTPYSPPQTTIMAWLTTLLAYLPLALIFHESLPPLTIGIEWLYLFCFSVAGIAAGWFLVVGLRHVDTGTAGILGLLEIVFALILGILLFAEHPSALDYLGITAILLAAAIPYYRTAPAQ